MEVRSSTGFSTAREFLTHQNQRQEFTQVERSPSQLRQSGQAQGSVDTSSRASENLSRREGHEWTTEQLDEAADAMTELSMLRNTSLSFERHEKLDRTMVKVIDQQTDEVIKEIPPEEFLDMISSMLEFAGILIDKKA
ncbi:flagellar protein FlaG [Salisediminibacterium selenitireducens]|uniref:Flagellar protein FlaG protein n=1 Tax=Bacillus selenitireducens (strain ATCC 700615 / DSM 15326 / MLS10) TaxID=439292 RepID=D6Y0X8_BACIE|nr:flagellar protein FlaG [Salisediminibacterium selenitireducens]ADH98582.1 flagellar protein FlaG protein [[Bacillus] selenitireducens MLS10]